MAEAEKEGLERKFKITSNISTANMVCFNARRQLHRYNSPQEILKEWCGLRLIYYSKRKVKFNSKFRRFFGNAIISSTFLRIGILTQGVGKPIEYNKQ
jgi:DNA topoisomerase-2